MNITIKAIEQKPEFNLDHAKNIIKNAVKFHVISIDEIPKFEIGAEIVVKYTDNYSVRVCNRLGYSNLTELVIVESKENMLYVFTAQLFHFVMGFYRNAEFTMSHTEEN
jgi:hypothetical protein